MSARLGHCFNSRRMVLALPVLRTRTFGTESTGVGRPHTETTRSAMAVAVSISVIPAPSMSRIASFTNR
ncbi:MAG: hypothetical protein H7Y61_03370 [Rhizobiales bacterium]|nr:hypothetical protein [Rhizobacter sp.]